MQRNVATATPKRNVVSPRIDVRAQFAFLRLFKSPDPAEQQAASELFDAVESGEIEGIYGDDLAKAAQLAKQRGTVRWELVPKGQDASLIEDGLPGSPVIVFKESAGKMPRLDRALLDVSRRLGSVTPRVLETLDRGSHIATTLGDIASTLGGLAGNLLGSPGGVFCRCRRGELDPPPRPDPLPVRVGDSVCGTSCSPTAPSGCLEEGEQFRVVKVQPTTTADGHPTAFLTLLSCKTGQQPGLIQWFHVKKCAPDPNSELCGHKKEKDKDKDEDKERPRCGPGTTDPFCLGFPSATTPCEPFANPDHALSVWAHLSGLIPNLTAVATRCLQVRPVWKEYFNATSRPFAFTSGCVVEAAKADPEGSRLVRQQLLFILNSVKRNLPVLKKRMDLSNPFTFPGQPVTELELPVAEAVRDKNLLHADITYNDPLNAAANLAGATGRDGKGSDVFGDDDRLFSGPVRIRVMRVDVVTGKIDGTIFYSRPQLHVKDTVDFCPGNLGNPEQRKFTLPMSKLEAAGLTRDVPITIDYPPPGRSLDFFGM